MRRIMILVFLCSVGLLSAGSPAVADEDAKALRKEAETVVKAMHDVYRGLETYQHTAEIVTQRYDEDATTVDRIPLEQKTVRMWFKAPDNVAFVTGDISVYCDGETLWAYSKSRDQYIERRAPIRPVLLLNDIRSASLYRLDALTPLGLLTASHSGLELVAPKALRVDQIEHARDHRTLSIETEKGYSGREMLTVDTSVSINVATGLLESELVDRLRMDRKHHERRKSTEPFRTVHHTERTTYSGIKVNEPIDDSVFVFHPAPGSQLVSRFEHQEFDDVDRLTLIGEIAPPFAGVDCRTGRTVSLDRLRGRVVVLWFTTTLVTNEHLIEHMNVLASKYDSERVSLVQVCNDPAVRLPVVKRDAEGLHSDIHVVHDPDRAINRSYRIGRSGTLVLLGTAGIVRDLDRRWTNEDEQPLVDRLSASIDLLLRGRPAKSEAAVAERQREAESRRSKRGIGYQRTHSNPSIDVEEINPHLLEPKALVVAKFFGRNGPERFDLDGDGSDEYLLMHDSGALQVLDADGSQRALIRLRSAGRIGSFRSVAGLLLGDRVTVAVSTSTTVHNGPTVSSLGVFDLDGEQLWEHIDESASKNSTISSVASGDLDEDGFDEIILTKSVSRFASDGDRTGAAACLEVLDGRDGTLLSRRALDSMVQRVEVLPREQTGRAPMIAVWSFDGLERFGFGG